MSLITVCVLVCQWYHPLFFRTMNHYSVLSSGNSNPLFFTDTFFGAAYGRISINSLKKIMEGNLLE